MFIRIKNVLIRLIFIILFLKFTYSGFAQIPTVYYFIAENLTGSELKTTLYNIIKDHKEFPYTSRETDTWDILKLTDQDPTNHENVILFYTGKSVNAQQEYNDRKGWNREHIWSKSRGGFGNHPGPGTDVHALRPCDIRVNSSKNNRWFAECDRPLFNDKRYKDTGPWISRTEWVVKPRSVVKGDVARMIFYMAVRYEGEDGELDLELINYIPKDKESKLPLYAKLSDLLAWHEEDPVDAGERRRNDIIYRFQNNRNPFIDHPEYVSLIWNNKGVISTEQSENEFIYYKLLEKIIPMPLHKMIKIENSSLRTGLHIFKDYIKGKQAK